MGKRKGKSNKGKQSESESMIANRAVLSACVCVMFWIFHLVTKSNELRLLSKLAFTTDSHQPNVIQHTQTVHVVECIKNGEMRQAIRTPKEIPWQTRKRNTGFSYHMYRIVLLHHFDIVFFSWYLLFNASQQQFACDSVTFNISNSCNAHNGRGDSSDDSDNRSSSISSSINWHSIFYEK